MTLQNKFISLFILSTSLVFSFTDNPVKYDLNFSKDKIAPGDDFSISIDIDIDPGFLIYSPNPLNLSPTGIEWTAEDSAYFEYISLMEEPESEIKIDSYTKMEVFYHTGSVNFKQNYKLRSNLNPGDTIILNGEFIYQACDDRLCVPYWDAFSKTIYIDNNSLDSNLTVKENVSVIALPKEALSDDNLTDSSSQDDDSSLIGVFFFAFALGLVAILTPCVFPMIPMTVAFFSKGENNNRKESIKTGLFFGFSIIAIFLIFGVLFSVLFKRIEFMNELASGYAANIIFAIVFIVFAISFFGAFEIRIPNRFLNKMNKKADSGGLLGTFFMALTLVLVSFSCTAPIVGSVMLNSMIGEDIWEPVISMLGFSLAFAIPFSLFALIPGWMQKLPKSGSWLNSVKIVLGFLELALAIKFLSMPFQEGEFSQHLFLILWIIIFFAMGLYLFGVIKFKGDDKKTKFGVGRIITIVINYAFCIYMVQITAGGSDFLGILTGIMPKNSKEPTSGLYSKYNVPINGMTEGCGYFDAKHSEKLYFPHGLLGYFDYEQAIDCAKENNKPLFIDFTGHACFNCRRMEEMVWKDSLVLKRMVEDYMLVALYVDDRKKIPENEWYQSKFDGEIKKTLGRKNVHIQIDKFGENAQPYYVLLDPYNEKELTISRAYDTNINDFIDFLDKGKRNFEEKQKKRNGK